MIISKYRESNPRNHVKRGQTFEAQISLNTFYKVLLLLDWYNTLNAELQIGLQNILT